MKVTVEHGEVELLQPWAEAGQETLNEQYRPVVEGKWK